MPRAGGDYVLNLAINDATNDISAKFLTGEIWKMTAHFLRTFLPNRLLSQLFMSDQLKVETVVEVVAVVSDLISQIGDLGFE